MSGADRQKASDWRAPRRPGPPERGAGITSRLKILLLCALSIAAYSVIHAPIAWWPIAYVCLVPWAVAVVRGQPARWVYVCSWLFGFGFYSLNLYWMWGTAYISIGGWHFPAGALALALFESFCFPLMAWPIRHMRRGRGWPLFVVLPIAWVASELLRAVALGGFPWFFLAHSHYRVLVMIQISDLAGAYALSFVIAAVNGLFAEALISRPAGKTGRLRLAAGGAFCAALLLATVGYGLYQLSRDTLRPGPKVAAIQGNFPCEVVPAPDSPQPWDKMTLYRGLIETARQRDPDLFVLPETPWYVRLNKSYWDKPPEAAPNDAWWSRTTHEYFRDLATAQNAYVVAGAMSQEARPRQVYPTSERFNSAYVYAPGSDDPSRYDKVHLVMFGEYVPFRGGRLHCLYRWLNQLTPWGADGVEYSLSFGNDFDVFEMQLKSQPGKTYRFGVPICYEDVMPYVSRRFVLGPDGSKRADFLLNISNDGWFGWGFELTQHLAASVFRAVENRVGIARAVNTGISAIIDPQGRIVQTVNQNGRTRGEGIVGSIVGPVMVDERLSLYTRTGDVFAVGCCLLSGIMLVDAVIARWLAVAAASAAKKKARKHANRKRRRL